MLTPTIATRSMAFFEPADFVTSSIHISVYAEKVLIVVLVLRLLPIVVFESLKWHKGRYMKHVNLMTIVLAVDDARHIYAC